MTDSDLVVTCKCGKVEVVVKDGYHDSDLLDAKSLGTVAHALCRHGIPRVYPHLFVSIRVFYSLLILLLAGVTVGVAQKNKLSEIDALLVKSHARYVALDYVTAKAELLKVLDMDPINDSALGGLQSISYASGN